MAKGFFIALINNLQNFALECEWEIYQRPTPQQLRGMGVQSG